MLSLLPSAAYTHVPLHARALFVHGSVVVMWKTRCVSSLKLLGSY